MKSFIILLSCISIFQYAIAECKCPEYRLMEIGDIKGELLEFVQLPENKYSFIIVKKEDGQIHEFYIKHNDLMIKKYNRLIGKQVTITYEYSESFDTNEGKCIKQHDAVKIEEIYPPAK